MSQHSDLTGSLGKRPRCGFHDLHAMTWLCTRLCCCGVGKMWYHHWTTSASTRCHLAVWATAAAIAHCTPLAHTVSGHVQFRHSSGHGLAPGCTPPPASPIAHHPILALSTTPAAINPNPPSSRRHRVHHGRHVHHAERRARRAHAVNSIEDVSAPALFRSSKPTRPHSCSPMFLMMTCNTRYHPCEDNILPPCSP
ncbi:hypothetical protein EVG20_g11581 [Dentipellis fragilis]|uniref:Uncharacterized protein n=1 Tax=Dentipellis fragilis TaxID=205917 RepID=A0A4Y9XKW6_9AGAM|nr:hypothetical protein EVG20_g11581 [Dentipellis fragilis]